MGKTVKLIIIATMLAISPNAVAEGFLEVAGGVALVAAGGGWISKESNDAEDAARQCQITGGCSTDSSEHLATGPVLLGAATVVGGLVLIFKGFSDEKKEPDYFTRDGFVMDGMTFGYTDTGKVGLQKKWEF